MHDLRSELAALPRDAWILFAGTFINRFGCFVHPFLVLYLGSRGYGPAMGGLAISAYGFGHLLASAMGGYLADRIGRRSTIVISMFCSAATMLALSRVERLEWILAFAALAGLAAELYRPAASALLGDLTPQGGRVIAFAAYRLSVNAGFALGPATAGFLASRSFTWLFVGDAITSVLYGFIALFALPRGMIGGNREAGWAIALRNAAADRTFIQFLAASAISAAVFFQFESTFALHVIDAGFSPAVYGALISLNGFVIIFLELPIASYTRRLPSPRRVMSLGFLLVGLGFAMNAFAYTIPLMIAGVLIWTAGEMTGAPLGGAYVADLAPDHLRGRYMGMWALTWSVGMITGPAAGTWLYGLEPRAVWIACLFFACVAAALMWDRRRVSPAESANGRGATPPTARAS